MNKRCIIFMCVLLVAVMVTACRKDNQSETTGVTVENSIQATAQATTGNGEEYTAEVKSTDPTEPEEVKMTDPATGETTGAEVNMGVADTDYIPPLEEDDTPDPTEGSKPTEDSKPTESTEPEVPSQPTDITTPTLPNGLDIRDITYEMYMNMSGEEQQAVIAQFGSIEDFMVWFNAVKAIYEAKHPNIEVGGNSTVDGSQIGNQ